jgi:uncharacterized protein YciW
MGDDETAYKYLSEALEIEKRPFWREYDCSMLAWLEKDPEIATALLRESCASDHPIFLQKAVNLAGVTGSAELQAHYKQRLDSVLSEENQDD